MIRILAVCSLLLVGAAGGERVRLFADGPVMLDAPIVFTGRLDSADDDSMYRWTWMDNASPNHYNMEEYPGTEATKNFTVTFPSDKYGPYEYEMSLTIYKLFVFFWKEVGKSTVAFNVTAAPNGKLVVTQDGHQSESLQGQSIVSSIKNTEMRVEFWDPSQYLAKARKITYFWFVDSVPFGQSSQGTFSYNFSDPGEHEVEVTVVAYFSSNHTLTTTTTTSTTTTEGPTQISTHRRKDDDGARSVIFLKRIVSKAPISNLTILGDQLLKHGQLVDLSLLCNGSGPFLYCWQLKETGYNITGNETCAQPMYQKDCMFPILWYFKHSDTYNLLAIISNDVSTRMEVIPVTIYEVAREIPIFIVIIPVASSIVVVILLISGIALYTSFKRNLRIEVADFDFNPTEDDELQYKTFWERLRESFGNALLGGLSETQSEEGSSVSGRRSVQLPGPGGIGYGSIT